MKKLFVLFAAICVFAAPNAGVAQSAQKWFTTYYATWSMLPLGATNFALPPWEIDYRGLTHIVLFDNGNVTQTAPYWAYMFGAPPARPSDAESDSVCVEYNGVANPGDGVHRTEFRDSLVTIAHRNGVKVVITIQAVNPVNLNYVAADSSRSQLLVNTLVAWAERKKFDGVELDWEGWASPLPTPDVINRFMRILYRRVHTMKTVSGAPGLIMVSAGSGQQSLYYPSQDYIVDQFNLQLYDYAYAWYGKIGSNASWHIAPLHKGTVDPTFEGQAYDTRGPLQWVAAGHDPKRIGLGVPTYGYILRNVDGLFQPMANPDYGSAHYQVIEALKSNGGVEEWDDVRKVRSIHGTAISNAGSVYYGSDGINAGQKFYATGENPQSLQEKVNWMNANNFGGIMTYDFVSDLDPTQSIASGKRNPLQRVVANALGNATTTPIAVVPLGTFSTSSATVPSTGGSVTLTWTSSNASSASIDQGVGTVALNGSVSVLVTTSKTYTLTLTSSTGTLQQYQVAVTVSAPASTGSTSTAPTKPIYNDNALTAPWSMDGTYSTTFDLANTEKIYKGTTSIKFVASGWAGILFRNGTWSSVATIDPSQYDSLHFAIHGGTTGAAFALWLTDASGTGVGGAVKFTVPANAWTVKSIPMSQFAAGSTPFAVIMLQLYQGTAATFYIDDVALIGKAAVATLPSAPAAPAPLAPANGASGQPRSVTLAWNPSTGASTYTIQLAADSLFASLLFNDSTVTASSRSVSVPGYLSTYYWRVNAKNSGGTSAYCAVQKFTTAAYVKTQPYFTYTPGTGSNATVAIPASASFSIAGSTLAAGDEIGAFTSSGLCVGAIEWNNANTALTVWGDNTQTPAVDGMRPGETIQYRVYRQAINTVYTLVSAQYASSGTGMYQPDALLQLASLSTASSPVAQATQTIPLVRGWNMVAPYVKPALTPIDSLTAQLAPSMTIVKNGVGQLYWPSMGINTLGYWNFTQGYMIYMENAGTFTVSGAAIQPEATPIQLLQGWNLAPFVRTSALNAATATAGLGTSLTIVKNNAGQVYWPAYNINTIGSLTPGQAYQFFLTQSQILLYPANALAKSGTQTEPPTTVQALTVHFPSLAGRTGDNQILLIRTQGLVDGDEIAVKTSANIIAGTAVVANGSALVTVWSDDQYTKDVVEGALAGQSLSLVRWSKSDGVERTLAVSHITDGLTGSETGTALSFTPNGLSVVQISIATSEHPGAEMPIEYALMQNFPNPFNPSTVIRYALPADGKVTLELFTMLGERVGVLINEAQHAGMHEVSFNASGYASGVYFYVLKSGSFSASKRMTLIK